MAQKKGPAFDTRTALLASAWALFQAHGYDAVSVDAIVGRASLSKGTFFHYFPTKLDLLESVCEHVSGPPWAALSQKVAGRSRPALWRLKAVFAGMGEWRQGHAAALVDVYRALARDGNTALRAKLAARQDALLQGVLVDILAQGRDDGSFSVEDASELARLVSAIVRSAGEGNLEQLAAAGAVTAPDIVEAVRRRTAIANAAIERVLGLRPGAIGSAGIAAASGARSRSHGRRSRPARA